VALTATSVYFFKWKPFWGRVKIKKELARLPRAGLRVKVARDGLRRPHFCSSPSPPGCEPRSRWPPSAWPRPRRRWPR
jgi:hypothetical protein